MDNRPMKPKVSKSGNSWKIQFFPRGVAYVRSCSEVTHVVRLWYRDGMDALVKYFETLSDKPKEAR